MKVVYLLGIDHRYQRADPGLSRAQVAAFRGYLVQICAVHRVCALAEEMSADALADHGCNESVLASVAAQLGLPHTYCDPSQKEQRALCIADENAVRAVAQMRGDRNAQIEELALQERRKREPVWASGIQALATFPTLFICGTWHIPSFSAVLMSHGLKPFIVHPQWDACQVDQGDAHLEMS